MPFLIFSFICVFIIVLLLVLFKIGAHFGRSDADEFRAVRCPQCQTRRKPEKTGTVRNLVELEMRCPVADSSHGIFHRKQTYPHVPLIQIICHNDTVRNQRMPRRLSARTFHVTETSHLEPLQ